MKGTRVPSKQHRIRKPKGIRRAGRLKHKQCNQVISDTTYIGTSVKVIEDVERWWGHLSVQSNHSWDLSGHRID